MRNTMASTAKPIVGEANNHSSRFIRVTKDNETHDRGFIAIDAICSVFENSKENNVSIMTMDGFWYDVVDGIEGLWKKVGGSETRDEEAKEVTKSGYFKWKKMMPPGLEKMPRKHSRGEMAVESQKRPHPTKTSDLPAGAGEGQNHNGDSKASAPKDLE